jgi:hypothetical protein
MSLSSVLKKNYFIYYLGRNIRLLKENLSNKIRRRDSFRIKSNVINGTKLLNLGEMSIKLDKSIPYEKKLILNPDEDCAWLQNNKLLLNQGDIVVIDSPKSLLIALYCLKISKARIIITGSISSEIKFELDQLYKKIVYIQDINNLNEYLNIKMMFTDRIEEYTDLNVDYILSGLIFKNSSICPHTYSLLKGRTFNGLFDYKEDQKVDIYLYSKKNLDIPNIIFPKKEAQKISSFSLLRSPDIYPFDICYSSVLEVADEFILGIDTILQEDTDKKHKERNIYIESFMDSIEPRYRYKIKIKKFDFKARFCKELTIPARWITDVNNNLLDRCKYNNIMYIMADEMYHENSIVEIKDFASQDKYESMWHYFLHFVQDLNHIRNPETAAYTHAVRVFKRDKFTCIHDGYSFVHLKGNNYLPRQIEAKNPIYHLGYVIDFRKKAEAHISEGGIFNFRNKESSFDGWIDNADLVTYNGKYPKYLSYKNMPNSKKIESFLNNIK